MFYGIQIDKEGRGRVLGIRSKVLLESGVRDGFQDALQLNLEAGIAVGLFDGTGVFVLSDLATVRTLLETGEVMESGNHYYLEIEESLRQSLTIFDVTTGKTVFEQISL